MNGGEKSLRGSSPHSNGNWEACAGNCSLRRRLFSPCSSGRTIWPCASARGCARRVSLCRPSALRRCRKAWRVYGYRYPPTTHSAMLHGSGLPFVNWKGPYPDDLWMSLYVESIGAGPDLVMLHGWAMHSGAWGGAVDRLTRHFRLHLVDLPGHGFSRGFNSGCMSASSASEESPSEALEYLVAMVEEILPDEAIVCWWWLGGQLEIELARIKLY